MKDGKQQWLANAITLFLGSVSITIMYYSLIYF